jgi:hypothetical protein
MFHMGATGIEEEEGEGKEERGGGGDLFCH